MFGRLCPLEHRAGLRHEELSGFRQLNPPPDPVEEDHRVARLQRRDRGTDRRLRQVQRFRRARHVFAGSHLQKNSKLIEGHHPKPFAFSERYQKTYQLDLCFCKRENGFRRIQRLAEKS